MSAHSVTWLDGVAASSLPLPDRGLDFGDGLFETLLLYRGTPLYPELHLERLQHGLKALRIPDCLQRVKESLIVAGGDIGDRCWDWSVLRLTVSRGAGLRGYAPPVDATPRIIATATQLKRDCRVMASAAQLTESGIRLAGQPALSGIKHLNRLEQVLAAASAKEEGADESLMLDSRDRLVSVIAGNLYVVREGKLLTPVLDGVGVNGTRRRLIIERWAGVVGLEVREVALTAADIKGAQEVFYSNSLYTVRPVGRVNHGASELSWESHPVCEALFDVFRKELP